MEAVEDNSKENKFVIYLSPNEDSYTLKGTYTFSDSHFITFKTTDSEITDNDYLTSFADCKKLPTINLGGAKFSSKRLYFIGVNLKGDSEEALEVTTSYHNAVSICIEGKMDDLNDAVIKIVHP